MYTPEYPDIIKNDILNCLTELDQVNHEVRTLEQLKSNVQEQNNVSAVKIAAISMESITTRLGLETVALSNDVSVAVETIGDTIAKIWEGVKKFFNLILNKIRAFFKYLSDAIFDNEKHNSKKAESVIAKGMTFEMKSGGTKAGHTEFIVDASSVSTEDSSGMNNEPVKYTGPHPELLLGEEFNSVNTGTSIINLNSGIHHFLNDSHKTIEKIKSSLSSEAMRGDYKETYSYIKETLPGLISQYFGSSEDDFIRNFKVKSTVYYNKQVVYRDYVIDGMMLTKIYTKEIEVAPPTGRIKITPEALKKAEEMRKKVVRSLEMYIRSCDKDIAAMILEVNGICDKIIRNDTQIANDAYYVDAYARLTTIRDSISYLVSFTANKIIVASEQSKRYNTDVMHLFSFCNKVFKHKLT